MVEDIPGIVVVLLCALVLSYDFPLIFFFFGCEFVGLCYTCDWVLILKLVFTLLSVDVNNQTELNWTVEEEEEEKEKKKKKKKKKMMMMMMKKK